MTARQSQTTAKERRSEGSRPWLQQAGGNAKDDHVDATAVQAFMMTG
jgi:hypothetical protein